VREREGGRESLGLNYALLRCVHKAKLSRDISLFITRERESGREGGRDRRERERRESLGSNYALLRCVHKAKLSRGVSGFVTRERETRVGDRDMRERESEEGERA
jgi:hypothetical protein